jgi:RNA recognition motif-containing protein
VKSVRVKRPQIHNKTFPSMTHAYSIAYLEFEKEEQAIQAQALANNSFFSGSVIQVEFYDNSQQSHIQFNPSDVVQNEYLRALFIKGFPKSVSIRVDN